MTIRGGRGDTCGLREQSAVSVLQSTGILPPRGVRAQSALEYLVTYGWGIFILILILALLWSMGLFNPSSFTRPAASAGGFASFVQVDHKVNKTAATLIFNNAVTRQVTITSVTVGVDDGTPDTSCSANPASVTANGKFNVSCASMPQGGQAFSGSDYDFTVKIDFTDAVSMGAHKDIGYIRGKVE